jgi:hypothetical protein
MPTGAASAVQVAGLPVQTLPEAHTSAAVQESPTAICALQVPEQDPLTPPSPLQKSVVEQSRLLSQAPPVATVPANAAAHAAGSELAVVIVEQSMLARSVKQVAPSEAW